MISKLEAKEQFYAYKHDNNESSEDYMYKLKAWAIIVVETLQKIGKISLKVLGIKKIGKRQLRSTH